MKKKLKIILPVYNEEKSILPLMKELKNLERTIKSNFIVQYAWVDDGSTDRTSKVLDSIKNKKNIVIHFINNFGKTNAILAGLNTASSDYIAVLDTDLQDNPLYIEKMLRFLITEDLDFVIGNRINRYKNNQFKKISSYFVRAVIKLFFPKIRIHDINCGIKVMTCQVGEYIYLKSDYHRYMPLIAHLRGFKVGEIAVKQRKRKFGVSKYGITGFMRTWNSLSDLLSIIFIFKFALNPFSFFGKLGIFSCILGFAILIYLVILWFKGTAINSRPLFFLGILAVTTGINFLSLGLIGDLIQLNTKENEYIVKLQRKK